MIRTCWQRGWFRWSCALVAGLVAGLAAPLPVGLPSARAGVAQKAKIYVFPYQPVFKGVPKEITTQTSDLLKNEIKQNEVDVELKKGPIFIPEAVATEVKPMSDRELKRARKLHERGEKLYEQLELQKAHKVFTAALEKYEQSLALLEDFDPVVDTLLMLSVCSYRLDREDEGAKMLIKVIRLRSKLQLDPAKYPPMFRNTMDKIRTRLLRKTRGQLEVVANTDGATVYFDGRKVGTAPILLKDLVPGEHYLRVEKEGLQTYATKTVIMPTKKVRVAAALGGVKKATGPLGEIAEAIHGNRVTPQVVSLTREQGQEIGADFVVLGGVAKVGENYKVGSYLVEVADARICSLKPIEFDPDLLGASVEVFNMAQDLFKKVEGCAEPVEAPFKVVETAAAKKTEVKAVAVGPAVPPPEAERQPARQPAAQPAPTRQPAEAGPARPGPAQPAPVARGPARPSRRPADQQADQQAGSEVATTDSGLATVGSSAVEPRPDPIVRPQVPRAQRGMPVIKDEQIDQGPHWYTSWWFWTLVSAAVVGGTAGGLYAGGVFDGGTSGGSVNVTW